MQAVPNAHRGVPRLKGHQHLVLHLAVLYPTLPRDARTDIRDLLRTRRPECQSAGGVLSVRAIVLYPCHQYAIAEW
jgi:hypothetical protein